MKEIESTVINQLSKNPEYEKALQAKANDLFRITLGKPTSEEFFLKKTGLPQEDFKTLMIMLITSGHAIRVENEDGVPRYQITSKPENHLRYLKQEEQYLKERLEWVQSRIRAFEQKQTEK